MHEKISNKASKLIKSLQQKKYRDQHGLFVLEGVKLVGEALDVNFEPSYLVYSGEHGDLPYGLPANALSTSERELDGLSSLKTANRIIAVYPKAELDKSNASKGPIFALDGVSDPGNLGTIIRICDWFGMPELICDKRCVDLYNPKVVQASMGSIFRVSVHYVDLHAWLTGLPSGKMVYAAHMEGQPLNSTHFGESPILVLGSEAHGLRPEVEAYCSAKLSIPRLGGGESLNVAVSAAIFASRLTSS
jgi:TrmH family RNA methyltransferase